jgi:hypothetical protein
MNQQQQQEQQNKKNTHCLLTDNPATFTHPWARRRNTNTSPTGYCNPIPNPMNKKTITKSASYQNIVSNRNMKTAASQSDRHTNFNTQNYTLVDNNVIHFYSNKVIEYGLKNGIKNGQKKELQTNKIPNFLSLPKADLYFVPLKSIPLGLTNISHNNNVFYNKPQFSSFPITLITDGHNKHKNKGIQITDGGRFLV